MEYARGIISHIPKWNTRILHEAKESLLFLSLIALLTGLILYKVVFIANMPLTPSFWTIYGLIATTFLVSRIPYSYLHKDDHSKVYDEKGYPTVTVVIAAKNEEDGIYKTIKTCVESHYPSHIECIVIDDGSTDNTSEEVLRTQKELGDKDIKLIKFEENKGKREAMTTGIQESKNEIIVFVDSDSFLAPTSMRHLVEHFLADPKVGAVSGNTKAHNANKNLLTKMQSIQYAVSFDIYKASESVHSAVTCCPGCFSAYRKDALKPLINAWKEHTFMGKKNTYGDDRALTNYVLRDWEIVYCQKALATTIVPESFKTYIKQQLRWKKSWIKEGLFAATFMWKKTHPLASAAFYISFSFPIIGPILAGLVLWKSMAEKNPLLFLIFISGFILLGMVYALFARVYYKAENWYVMPLFSLLFICFFIWQMPYALFTLRNTGWGTR